MKQLALTILCSCLSFLAVAQISSFLPKGQSGSSVSIGAEKGESLSGFTTHLGTSLKGIFDIDLSFASEEYDGETLSLPDNATGKYYEIACTWWFLRSVSANLPNVNIGLRPGYEFANYDDYRYTEGSQTLDYKGYYGGELGIKSNVVFHCGDKWMIQPFYNIEYELGHDKENGHQVNYNGLFSSLGISIAAKAGKGNLFLSLSQNSGTYGYGDYFEVSAGYLFPW
jgi:hypothetical protein